MRDRKPFDQRYKLINHMRIHSCYKPKLCQVNNLHYMNVLCEEKCNFFFVFSLPIFVTSILDVEKVFHDKKILKIIIVHIPERNHIYVKLVAV